MLIPLIKLDTNKGSQYYTDDHTAYYATLSNWKTPDNCSWNVRRITYVKILLLISMVLNDYGAMPRHGYIIIAVYPGNTFISI